MLGAARVLPAGPRCFAVELACMQALREASGLSAAPGRPKPFSMSDKHRARSSAAGYETDFKALRGMKKKEKINRQL